VSAKPGTKVFGVRVGLDPKILVGGLILLAGTLFWYNSSSDEVPSAPTASQSRSAVPSVPDAPPPARPRANTTRRVTNNLAGNDRGALRMRPVDATRGDVDPTLRLDLLSRLHAVPEAPTTRSLFEIGAVTPAAALAALKTPTIMPKPLPTAAPPPTAPVAPTVNVPLKYYGFVRPFEAGQNNQGLFLEGDNVLVLSEGDTIKKRYLIVELTQNNARVEDIELKQGQTLPLIPVAMP
jgi:hypothetical protein